MDDEIILVKKTKKEEEKRKKRGIFGFRNRKMFLLIVAFIFTIIILSTSTYAWFTSNYTVSIQPIDVQVSSGSGIQISTDGEHWKSMVTLADIQAGYSGTVSSMNKVPADVMSPVSTVEAAYENNAYPSDGLHMFRGTIVNDVTDGTMYLNSVEELDNDANNNNYIAFDIFLKLDFKDEDGPQPVYFTSGTGITTYGAANTNIEYAGRMGFVIQGNQPSSNSPAQFRAMKGHSLVAIYEPNYDVHTANGLANGRDNYGITTYVPTSGATAAPYEQSGNLQAVPYYGLISAFAYDSGATPLSGQTSNPTGVPLDDTDQTRFALVDPTYKTTYGNNATFDFTNLSPGVTKIRVYMWIEGQDIDCENNASGGNVQFNLGFTLREYPTPTPAATTAP